MFRFEELEIWRLAVEYGKHCYLLSKKFPRHELFALGDQLRRAALSPSNNIAEGSVGTATNFKRYLIIAIGSTLETVNILNFALELEYITKEERDFLYSKAELLIKKIRSFMRSLD